MNTQQAITALLHHSEFLVQAYLEGITDAQLLKRPVPAANHIAWQLGHLIASEHGLVETVVPGAMPVLPEAFKERHSAAASASNERQAFLKKEEYLSLAQEMRAATLQAVAAVNEADLDKPTPAHFPPFIKTNGDCLLAIGPHWLSHLGQWIVLRRKLGLPQLF
jgi:hypothetical protein